MRGFEAGDEIDFWPTWRSDNGKARRIRATLLDWDEHGMTVRLDQEYRKLTFLPWVQVRLLQKVTLPRPEGSAPAAAFRWTQSTLGATEQPAREPGQADESRGG